MPDLASIIAAAAGVLTLGLICDIKHDMREIKSVQFQHEAKISRLQGRLKIEEEL